MQVTVKGRFIGGGLYKPRDNNGKMQYSACVVLDDAEAKKVQNAINKACEEEFGGKKPPGFRDWGVRVGDDEEYEHSFEQKFINPKSSAEKPPRVVRRDEGELVDCEDVYAGCYVSVSVQAYAYKGSKEKKIKPGASLSLRAVLFWKHGEKIGNAFDNEEFDGYESELDDSDTEETATSGAAASGLF